VASDLLSQAEHGIDSNFGIKTHRRCWTGTNPNGSFAEKEQQRRSPIKANLRGNDKIALELINEYGPEHFIICTGSDNFIVTESKMQVGFIGNYTPESAEIMLRDQSYLPTNGYAKNYRCET
jgi:histidinol dehydrogenase